MGCLAPVLISFFYGTGQYGEHGPAWNTVLLFGGEQYVAVSIDYADKLLQAWQCRESVCGHSISFRSVRLAEPLRS